jgi:hypothetical protein
MTVAAAAMNDSAAAVPRVGSLRDMYVIKELILDRDLPGEVSDGSA